jgi:hypothetical protein
VNPPEHTIIIEADIRNSVAKRTHRKIKEHLRHRIITTCIDADVMAGIKTLIQHYACMLVPILYVLTTST